MVLAQHDEEKQLFYVAIEGKVATLKYNVIPGREVWDYYSTYVPPQFRHRGVAKILVMYALDYASKHHLQIIPTCPYVQHIIEENPDFEKLVYVEPML